MSCGNDYPPIDPYFSFNIPQSVVFSLSNTASTNKDTTLIAVGKIDTMNYVQDSSSAYLLHTAEVWKLTLQSSNGFTLDQLGYARILIGTDTVAFDTLPPQSAIDTTLVLTKTDITPYMRDTSFTASLLCRLKSVPENPVTITCNMTVIYTSADQNF